MRPPELMHTPRAPGWEEGLSRGTRLKPSQVPSTKLAARSRQLSSFQPKVESRSIPKARTGYARAAALIAVHPEGAYAKSDSRKSNSRKSASRKSDVHVVRRGENLALIAKKYKVSVRELASHNRLKNQSTLWVGKRLEIPSMITSR